MSAFRRACEAEGCGEVVSAPKRFCGEHWSAIPEDLQRRLFDALEGPDRDAVIHVAVERLKVSDKRRRTRGISGGR